MSDFNLKSYLQYCLGYSQMANQANFLTDEAGKGAATLSADQLDLAALMKLDSEAEKLIDINLPIFEKNQRGATQPELRKKYEEEAALADKLRKLEDGYKNNRFTKQLELRFGYFEINLSPEEVVYLDSTNGADTEVPPQGEARREMVSYPLFSIQVALNSDGGKIKIKPVVDSIVLNVSGLESAFPIEARADGMRRLNEIVREAEQSGLLEIENFKPEVLVSLWGKVRAQLGFSHATFGPDGFTHSKMRILLVAKANFFLADDLKEIAKIDDNQNFQGTSLDSWQNEVQPVALKLPGDNFTDGTKFFPFPSDRYQDKACSLLGEASYIIQGPPGTGKSQTICNLICHLAALGKTVLFVSQKPQALKVVKDRLKSCEILGLYGYIPNTNSDVLTEEDINDGISGIIERLKPKLDQIERVGDSGAVTSDSKVIDQFRKVAQVHSLINRQHVSERKLYTLLDQEGSFEADTLLTVADPVLFAKAFSSVTFSELEAICFACDKLQDEKTGIILTDEFKEWARINNAAIERLDAYASTLIERIAQAVEVHLRENMGYFANWYLRRRVLRAEATALNTLPAEIADDLRNFIADKTLTKTSILTRIKNFKDVIRQKTIVQELAELSTRYQNILRSSGANQDTFNEIWNRRTLHSVDDIIHRNNVLRGIQADISHLKNERLGFANTMGQLGKAEEDKRKEVSGWISERRRRALVKLLAQGQRIRSLVVRISKDLSKSKKAYKTFDKLKQDNEATKVMLSLLPVWIMEMEDASRIFARTPGLFDYVIIDEASQCDVCHALPALYRAKHAVLVGDSQQMRVPFFFKRNSSLRDLGQRYGIHEHFQIKSEGEPIKSILEIGASLGFRQIALQQHYRSPAELIGFSNDNFYKPNGAQLFPVNHRYIPFGDTQRVMLVHQVNATTAAASPTENPDEAALALEIYRKLKSDPKTKNLSIGIVTFFNDQASLIRRHFEDHGVKEDGKMLKVSMVEGIQGDEKDVIIYSFVITNADTGKRIYVPRTGEGGDINKIVNAGRVNVAFSRARCQTHTLISMPIAELPEGIWIKRYARYADANGQIQCEDKVDTDKFDSNFEREFYDFARGQLLNWGIANQVRSCGFRIDFVVISPDGARVAIECDGPTHFTDESSTERTVDDVERESILRAAGWRFVRIRYTDWVDTSYNRAKVIEEIQTTAK